MKYRKLWGTDKMASALAYGTPHRCCESEPEEAYDYYEKAYDYGFRIFDTANSYGKAEENMGYWIERSGHREDIILHDKGCNPQQEGVMDEYSGDTIRTQVALSLERFRTDYIDYYVLHRDDPSKPVDEIVEALNELKDAGKIRHFGGSNWTMARMIEANKYAEAHGLEGFTVLSPCYSLAVLARDPWGGSVTISGDANRDYREWLTANQMPVLPYSPQARGFLSGKYKTYESTPIEDVLSWGTLAEYNVPENIQRLKRVEAMAAEKGVSVSTITLAWLLAQPQNIFPIIGSTGEKHIEEAILSLDTPLTKEECDHLLNG